MYADCYVNSKDDIPDGPHYLILKFSSISIPGDERSRTHPGHGYPARSETVVKAEVYLSEDRLKQEILRLDESSYQGNYRVLYVNTVDVTKKVTLHLDKNL
jgi:hypothetical protein